MVLQPQQQIFNEGSKKRAFMPHELLGRFSSKNDFIKYFKEQLQLYLPPEYMMNKDFLKEVLIGSKKLLKLNEVNYVNVPKYDELSVLSFWPQMQKNEEFMLYFPSKFPRGRVPDRVYFWNIMNTIMSEYTIKLIRHANEQRTTTSAEGIAQQVIQVNEEWAEKLMALPFKSLHKGRTVHLLKAGSKIQKLDRKRRKIQVVGTPEQWFEAQKQNYTLSKQEPSELKQQEQYMDGQNEEMKDKQDEQDYETMKLQKQYQKRSRKAPDSY